MRRAVDADTLQNALDKLRFEHRVATEEVGGARQRLGALASIARRRAEKLEARKKLAADQGLFEELREAFGKRGVPAMIIEAAVPEIEAAANQLLRRMTDGRMNVRFNTQRETQAEDVRETLDIQIADELGTRAYENYSGGEQFRTSPSASPFRAARPPCRVAIADAHYRRRIRFAGCAGPRETGRSH